MLEGHSCRSYGLSIDLLVLTQEFILNATINIGHMIYRQTDGRKFSSDTLYMRIEYLLFAVSLQGKTKFFLSLQFFTQFTKGIKKLKRRLATSSYLVNYSILGKEEMASAI